MTNISSQDWFRRETVIPSVTRIWEPHVHRFFRSNIWLVTGRDADLVIDFGMGLVPLRPALQLSAKRRTIALATHSHVDHIGGFCEFDERLGHDAEKLAFATVPNSATLADSFQTIERPVSEYPTVAWDAKAYRLRAAALTCPVHAGDVVDLGDFTFEVLHLPGHSPGSIGLLDRQRRILFSGDAIYSGQLVDDTPGADRKEYVDTMRRLSDLDVDLVFGGHNEPILGDAMRRIARDYLNESR